MEGLQVPVQFSGAGFTPGAPVEVSVDNSVLGTLTADAAGAIAQGFKPPALSGTTAQSSYVLTAVDTTNPAIRAQKKFYVSQFLATFQPHSAVGPNLARFKGRFEVYGLGALRQSLHLKSTGSVYIHWARKGARTSVGDRAIGKLKGPCGSTVSKRQTIFPFPQTFGTFILAFDFSSSYKKNRVGQLTTALTAKRL
jgi:hypothetical protein